MDDSNSKSGNNEDQSLADSQSRGQRSGVRPRHQHHSAHRGGHQQSRNRTFANTRHVEGNYRQSDHLEDATERTEDNSQHYHASRHRPFKYHQAGRHHKRYGNERNHDSSHGSRWNADGDEKPLISNTTEDFSLLSVVAQKQGFEQDPGDQKSYKQSHNPAGNEKQAYKNRGYRGRRNNHGDNLSLLSGIEEKQNWRDSSRNEHNESYGKSDKGFWEEEETEKVRTHRQASKENTKELQDSRGDYEQFRWYGRRNFNPFGKQGSYRTYEEPVNSSVRDHYSYSNYQRPQHRRERPLRGFHQVHDGRGHRHAKARANARSYNDVEDDDATQRERLLQQLKEGDLECMVCCECVRHRDPIWSCLNCYHIFHLHCIRKWARSPTAVVEGSGWRCPACQAVKDVVPSEYFCYCAKVKDPERSYHDTPHSCGNVCGRKQADEFCNHPCAVLCHPGPCPPCSAMVTCSCPCGRITLQIRCGKSKSLTCDEVCGKVLNCGIHKCSDKCHTGSCQPCSTIIRQECYCSKVSREVACTETTSKAANYSCGQVCNKVLACGEHNCDHLCHDGTCFSCRLLPENVVLCPCGKSKVTDLLKGGNRQKCTDPVPTCNNDCLKILQCGPEDDRHACYTPCHAGACPPCPLKTNVRCRCGGTSKDFFCTELTDSFHYTCEKRCNKKKRCGRHKCLQTCCTDAEHLCLQVCNQKLTCGLHTCQDLCHIGNCKPCLNASFEELTCRCGHSVRYPPIPCGARPPECDQLCTRDHPCDHPPQHKCHSDHECPPCTVLSEKWCFGGHEKRSNLPCFLDSLSCGLPCQKGLPCGQHKCQQTCHEGKCQGEDSQCNQPCPVKRTECDHPCGAPCHLGKPCPETSCKQLISMTCICGTRTEKVPCSENSRLFRQMSASLLASKMQDIQSGASVDISDVLRTQKKNKLNRLECNEECSLVERNRRLALALQIRNPDLSSKPGPPSYTEFLKDEARKNPAFMKSIHDKLTDLVQLAKQSKQKSRSYSFPPMNREQRRVVHEMSDYFGCETESFDQEPKRNVVVTAFRDRSYLPSSSVMSVVQREMGQRKAPAPMIHLTKDSLVTANKPSSSTKDPIDYFDFPQ